MKITIEQKEFNFLLDKVKNLKDGERTIKLDDRISLFFRYSTVRVAGIVKQELMFPVLDPEADNENVISLVFDAKGLYNDFITEIEVFRAGKNYLMFIIPPREAKEIDYFRKLLKAEVV